jgi:hypothetical protein
MARDEGVALDGVNLDEVPAHRRQCRLARLPGPEPERRAVELRISEHAPGKRRKLAAIDGGRRIVRELLCEVFELFTLRQALSHTVDARTRVRGIARNRLP